MFPTAGEQQPNAANVAFQSTFECAAAKWCGSNSCCFSKCKYFYQRRKSSYQWHDKCRSLSYSLKNAFAHAVLAAKGACPSNTEIKWRGGGKRVGVGETQRTNWWSWQCCHGHLQALLSQHYFWLGVTAGCGWIGPTANPWKEGIIYMLSLSHTCKHASPWHKSRQVLTSVFLGHTGVACLICFNSPLLQHPLSLCCPGDSTVMREGLLKWYPPKHTCSLVGWLRGVIVCQNH